MQLLAELCAHPGREFHVLALSGSAGEGGLGGDAGEVLDAEAIADYRARVEELDDEIAEAESFGDGARATRARQCCHCLRGNLLPGAPVGRNRRR